MAKYNLETETTTHLKGMSFGESSDTQSGYMILTKENCKIGNYGSSTPVDVPPFNVLLIDIDAVIEPAYYSVLVAGGELISYNNMLSAVCVNNQSGPILTFCMGKLSESTAYFAIGSIKWWVQYKENLNDSLLNKWGVRDITDDDKFLGVLNVEKLLNN